MKTLNKDLVANQVIEQLTDLADYELIAIHNDYCEVNNDSYSHIIDNDDEAVDSMFDSPSEAMRAARFGDYNHSHNYFILNGYANLVSFNYTSDDNSPIDISELAQWLINEDKLSEYDISVTTLDDMLASIEDNISDIDSVDNIIRLLNYLDIDYLSLTEWLTNDRNDIDSYIQNYIDFIIEVISNDMEYDTLVNLCDYFNVEY